VDAVFITGLIYGSGFPVTASAIIQSPAHGSIQNGFVEEFTADGTILRYATYLCGQNGDTLPTSIVADGMDDATFRFYYRVRVSHSRRTRAPRRRRRLQLSSNCPAQRQLHDSGQLHSDCGRDSPCKPEYRQLRLGQLLVAALTGVGIQSHLLINPASLNFGNVVVGQTASLSLTLANVGTAPISRISFTITTDYLVTAPRSFPTLAAGASCSVTIAFTPRTAGPVPVPSPSPALISPRLTRKPSPAMAPHQPLSATATHPSASRLMAALLLAAASSKPGPLATP